MNIRWLKAGWLLSILVCNACCFDRDYSLKHPVNIPKRWSTHDPYVTRPITNPRCFAWWHQYHDPALNQLIAQGLKNNNDIHIAMANIEAAQGELKRVELNWIPSITGNLGYSSFPYLGYPGVLATMAVPVYTVNIFNQIKSQQRAFYELKVTKAMRDGVKLTVIADIASAYYNHLAQQERLQLLETVEHDLTESLHIYNRTQAHGLTTAIDVNNAQAKLDLIQAEETLVKKNLIVTQNALRALINQNPHPFLFKKTFSAVDSHQMVVDSLPLAVIEHRPDMIAARNELNATRSGIGVALSRFFPEFQLGIARGDIATIPNGHTLGMPIYFNQAIFSQPLITVASFGELDRARGVSKAAYYRYLDTLRKALRDVDNDLAAHRYSTERLDKTVAAKNAVRHAYQLNQDLYHKGIRSYLDLLQQKIRLDEIKIVVNKHKIEQTLAVIHLYEDLAVGYGYQPEKKACCQNPLLARHYSELYPYFLNL